MPSTNLQPVSGMSSSIWLKKVPDVHLKTHLLSDSTEGLNIYLVQ